MLGLATFGAAPALHRGRLGVRFGETRNEIDHTAGELRLAIPVLGDERQELVPSVADDLLVGVEIVSVDSLGATLEESTFALYRRILQRTGPAGLCRIWNYVPQINQAPSGLENYRAFCRGRAAAFEAEWGRDFVRRLPAASAVGGPDQVLAVVFAVSSHEPVAFENPQQVPAYAYPPEHGPRAPSFCRATCARGATQDWVFVSGTASIKGHRTVSPGDLVPQIACTLDNLRLVSQACGLRDDLGAGAGWQRQFKVYLRHAKDFARTRDLLNETLLRASDSVVWLRSDICRADLDLEIEATLHRPVSRS